jgi:uncharacterized protein YgfB (UPF0149 family)
MAEKELDLDTLRAMARVLSDFDCSEDELARMLPYVNKYLKGMQSVAHIDLTSIEPEAMSPAWHVEQAEK